MIAAAVVRQWKIECEVAARPNPPAMSTLWMEGAEALTRNVKQTEAL